MEGKKGVLNLLWLQREKTERKWVNCSKWCHWKNTNLETWFCCPSAVPLHLFSYATFMKIWQTHTSHPLSPPLDLFMQRSRCYIRGDLRSCSGELRVSRPVCLWGCDPPPTLLYIYYDPFTITCCRAHTTSLSQQVNPHSVTAHLGSLTLTASDVHNNQHVINAALLVF